MCTKPIYSAETKPYDPAIKMCDFQPLYSDRRQTEMDSKKSHTATIKCPNCHNKVKLLTFGEGWVGVCCNQLVYNQRNLPVEQEE
jgi:hypothetical protein